MDEVSGSEDVVGREVSEDDIDVAADVDGSPVEVEEVAGSSVDVGTAVVAPDVVSAVVEVVGSEVDGTTGEVGASVVSESPVVVVGTEVSVVVGALVSVRVGAAEDMRKNG